MTRPDSGALCRTLLRDLPSAQPLTDAGLLRVRVRRIAELSAPRSGRGAGLVGPELGPGGARGHRPSWIAAFLLPSRRARAPGWSPSVLRLVAGPARRWRPAHHRELPSSADRPSGRAVATLIPVSPFQRDAAYNPTSDTPRRSSLREGIEADEGFHPLSAPPHTGRR